MTEHSKRKKARSMLSKAGYAKVGGHMKGDDEKIATGVHEHESAMHPGKKKTPIRLRDGGVAEGSEPKPRADRMSRGGHAKHKGKGHTTVNVMVGSGHPQPVPVPVPKPVPVPVNAGAGGPPGAGPMPMPPGGVPDPNAPPMGLKTGGRAKKDKIDSQRSPIKGISDGQFKKGGRTRSKYTAPMEDGAGGGLGRLEKAKAYGA